MRKIALSSFVRKLFSLGLKKSGQDITHRRRSLGVDPLECRLLLAADFEVYDINQTGSPAGRSTIVYGDNLYYWDASVATGSELYKLDTRTQETSLFFDVNPGVGSSHSSNTDTAGFAIVNNNLYFVAYDANSGERVRRINLADSVPQLETLGGDLADLTWFSPLQPVGNKIYTLVSNSKTGIEMKYLNDSDEIPSLHSSDVFGIENGQAYVEGPNEFRQYSLMPVGDRLFFWSVNVRTTLKWIDTTLDTPVVHTIDTGSPTIQSSWHGQTAIAGDKFFFWDYGQDNRLALFWISTADANPTPHPLNVKIYDQSDLYSGFALLGDRLYFTATDDQYGSELRWLDYDSDPSTIHTVDLAPGPSSSRSGATYGLTVVGDKLFFDTSATAQSLTFLTWIDLTVANPEPHSTFIGVPDIYYNRTVSRAIDDKLLIVVYDTFGSHLAWIDTSIAPSTLNFTDLFLGFADWNASLEFLQPAFAQSGDQLYFYARTSLQMKLWQVDASQSQLSFQPIDTLASTSGSVPDGMTAVGNKLYFTADDGSARKLRWIDTEQSVRTVQTLEGISDTRILGVVGTRVYFSGTKIQNKSLLFWIDSALDVPLVHTTDVSPDSSMTAFFQFAFVDDKLFLQTSDANGFVLKWVDTSEVASQATTIELPGQLNSDLYTVGTRMYFLSYNAQTGNALYWLDASDIDPTLRSVVLDPNSQNTNTSVQFALVNEKLYISYRAGNSSVSLSWIDTSLEDPIANSVVGTDVSFLRNIGKFSAVEDKLFFLANETSESQLRWIDTDSAPSIFNTIDSVEGFSGSFATFGNRLFFAAANAAYGMELRWIDVSDPTHINTLDTNPGNASSLTNGTVLSVVGNRLYFASGEGDSHWLDPAAAVLDSKSIHIAGTLYTAQPTNFLIQTEHRVYFSSGDPNHGYELWWFDINDPDQQSHVIDLNSGPQDSTVYYWSDTYTYLNGRIYLRAISETFGSELVSVDTTAAPSDIHLSQDSIDENVASVVATITSDDVDFAETFIYSLVAGQGDEDNDRFSIVDDKLVLNAAANFEANPQLHVRLRATDATNRSLEKSFVINVRDVAEAPVAVSDTYNVPMNYFKDFKDATGLLTSDTLDNGVLANDSDGDGDTITAELITPPLNGTLTLHADGTFRYRPHPLASQGQIEHFTYRVTDSTGLSSEATVTLNIGARIDSPFYNQTSHTDVSPGTSPGTTSSLDALALINFLNAHRGRISIPVEELPQVVPPEFYYDVNNDFVISSLDILAVYNYLNLHSRDGEGEGTSSVTTDSNNPGHANLFDAAIVDLTELANKRNSRRFAF